MGITRLLTSHRSRAWLYGTLGVVFLRALPNLRYLIGRDQATHCVIGEGLLQGKLLYRDLWENRPPGVNYVYALIVKIFGPVMWSIGLVDILWVLVISCCIFYFARRYLGAPGAALSAIFFACRHCRQGYVHAAQPESFLMLCIFAAWFLLMGNARSPGPDGVDTPCSQRGQSRILWVVRYLAVGLVLGAAFWFKYNAVVFFPFLALVPFVDFHGLDRTSVRVRLTIPWKDWFGRMLMVSAGAIFVVVALLAYFQVSGAWPAMKEVQFEVLPRYGAMAFHPNFDYLYWALGLTQNHLGIWWEFMPAVTLLIAWWRRELGRIAPFTLMALAGYICTAAQLRFHPYYFETCYPLFALFWGYVCIRTYDGFRQLQRIFAQRQWTLARGLLWVVFASLVFSLLPEESVRVVEQYKFAADWWRDPDSSYKTYYWQLPLEKIGDQLRVIDYLKTHSRPQDQVFVWGTAPLINFLPQRENPSRFTSNLGLMSKWAPESWRQELARTLEAKQPRYIVVERHDMLPSITFTMLDSEQYLQVYPALAGLLDRQYETAVDYYDFKVYRLK